MSNDNKPINNDNDVATLIKAKRISLNLSLRDFAQKYGISTTVLNQLELGRIKTPSMKTISLLANALEMPITVLCSMYSIPIDNNDVCNKENKPIDIKQGLIEALLRYGISDTYLNEVFGYIDYLKDKSLKERTENSSDFFNEIDNCNNSLLNPVHVKKQKQKVNRVRSVDFGN